MNKSNYKLVVYFIGIIIVITIAVQFYWNYREYQINKQHLISKVQLSLDNSLETYFANLTKSGIITFKSKDSINATEKIDTIIVSTNSRRGFRKKIDSTLQNIANLDNDKPIFLKTPHNPFPFFNSKHSIPKNIDSLIHKVIISISRDSLNLEKLDSYLIKEFKRNRINVTYGLKYNFFNRNFSEVSHTKNTIDYKLEDFPEDHLKAVSNSPFLPHKSKLELHFTNTTKTLLRDSSISILLSFLLSASIIISLIYLLKTIYKQKQLADVKNDLINNITHEFKTPIATISTVLEAMKSFNALDDKEKSEKYISMASSQVHKLNVMVEKILETAALNHEELAIIKKPVNINELIEDIVKKYSLVNEEKTFSFNKNADNLILNLDKFHFENALSNIVDNAIKYGGNKISIELNYSKSKTLILIKDNGNGIHKNQKDKVFEQFYRIPTGNTHNVKGFGIGLYYTKKIIEKHEGSIDIIYDKNDNTLFKIELLNE